MTRVWFGEAAESPAPGWEHVTSDAAVVDLETQIERADELWINDPLSFPWDTIGASLPMPITVELRGLTLLDMAALAPWLDTLGPGDRIRAGDTAVEGHMRRRFGTDPVEDDQTFEERNEQKAIHRCRERIISRLEKESLVRGDADTTIIVELTQAQLFASTQHRFADNITSLLAAHGSGRPFEVWGVRAAPGQPTVGAVVALRLDDPAEVPE